MDALKEANDGKVLIREVESTLRILEGTLQRFIDSNLPSRPLKDPPIWRHYFVGDKLLYYMYLFFSLFLHLFVYLRIHSFIYLFI